MGLKNIKFDVGNKTIIISLHSDDFFGFTICESKKVKKIIKKQFEHFFLNKEDIQKIISAIYNAEKLTYINCSCMSEILRIIFDEENNCFYFDIFDNYYLKYKKIFIDNIMLTAEQAKDFIKIIRIIYENKTI